MESIYNILLLILVAWFVVMLLWNILVRSLLYWRATVVEGCIIDKSQVRSLRYGTLYFFTYKYDYLGKAYTHKTKVNKASYDMWSEGDEASVRCFPAFGYIARLDL